MKIKNFLIIFLFLILILHPVKSNPLSFERFENITKLAYDHRVYVEYVNDTPYFYLDAPRDFVYTPVVVCAEVYEDTVKDLGFKVSCKGYDVTLTNRSNVKGKAIVIYYAKGRLKKLVWLENPLNLPSMLVFGRNVSERGEVIAKYSDGGNAIVKVGDKIFVGCSPNKPILANLLAIYSIKRVGSLSPIVVVTLTALGFASIVTYIYNNLQRILYRILWIFSILIAPVGYVWYHDKEKVLLNDTRRRIYEHILDNPYTHLREIVRELNISISSATWHLRILEKAGLVGKMKVGNRLVFYPTGMEEEDLIVVATLNNERASKIVNYLLKVGEAHLRKISRDLNMNVETVRYNVRKLESMGIVTSKEKGNRIVYTINPKFIPSLSDRA